MPTARSAVFTTPAAGLTSRLPLRRPSGPRLGERRAPPLEHLGIGDLAPGADDDSTVSTAAPPVAGESLTHAPLQPGECPGGLAQPATGALRLLGASDGALELAVLGDEPVDLGGQLGEQVVAAGARAASAAGCRAPVGGGAGAAPAGGWGGRFVSRCHSRRSPW